MKHNYKLFFLLLLFPLFTRAQSSDNHTSDYAPPFFVGVALNSSSYSYQGSDELSKAKASKPVSPQFNAGVNIYFDKSSQAFVFRIELGYTSSKVQLSTTYNNDVALVSNNYDTETLKFNQGIGSLTPQLVWNAYNGKSLKVFIDAGVAIDYCHYSNKSFNTTTYYSTSNTSTTSAENFPAMHSIIFNVPLKAGLNISNLVNIYAAYLPKTALNSNFGEAYNYSAYQFGVDYSF